MNEDMVLYLGRRTLEMTLLLSAPVLGVTLVLGILTAMLQAVTSMKDMTMGLVIKLAAVGVTLIIAGSWMIQTAMGFTNEIFNHMQSIGH